MALFPTSESSTTPPPYHEGKAYPKTYSRRLQPSIFSLPGGLTALVSCILICNFLLLSRHAFPQDAAEEATSSVYLTQFQSSLDQCTALNKFPPRIETANRQSNPRWNAANGQTDTVVLRNATLFDGERFFPSPVDIVFQKGLIISVSKAGSTSQNWAGTTQEYDLMGQWVTPGLVDMHSHHTLGVWPQLSASDDINEIHPDSGPLTPFLRVIDGMKAYDTGMAVIASGGVTTSLIIPGSTNIIGGEGTVIKNRNWPGLNKELVVEDLLAEWGIPLDERHRYMKMACGENPKVTYGHTRMANAWVLRKHLTRAKQLLERQDAWCAAAMRLSAPNVATQRSFLKKMGGGFPGNLELESTVGLLRGRVAMHNHCYEPHDMETMIRISKEFGFRIRAFHHALAAWEVPEMLREYGQNLTVATFAEFGLYKWEAYDVNLYAGKILNDHGVLVAYKSDHSTVPANAKYLINQAAMAHSFHLPADVALKAVTSVPAMAIDMDDRVGFIRKGYDADIVVWDSHPLSVGATPMQVFIDGVATLDPDKAKETMGHPAANSHDVWSVPDDEPRMRASITPYHKKVICNRANEKESRFIITGITGSFLENYPELAGLQANDNNLTLVITNGRIEYLGSSTGYESQVKRAIDSSVVSISLSNGYLAPGLTAVTNTLGLQEIVLQDETGDGTVSPVLEPTDGNLNFAKYGLVLNGKGLTRARLGGVTKAVTAPLSGGGLVRGVSAGFLTSGKRTILDKGIFKEDVAVHFDLGELSKISHGAVSFAVKELRRLVGLRSRAVGKTETQKMCFAAVFNGSLPLVIHAKSARDIQQVILIKRDLSRLTDCPRFKFIIFGGHEAYIVADELAEAEIPVILTANRGAFSSWETLHALPGPPLTRSPASILSQAGVLFTLAMDGDPPEAESRLHDLAIEASWAAKYAGLSDQQAIRLVSRNVEDILGLERSRDIVLWEGSPLKLGRPVLAFQSIGNGTLELATCWPDEGDYV